MLTTQEAAVKLGVKPVTIRQAVARGKLTPAYRNDRILLFDPDEIARYDGVRRVHYKLRKP